MNKSALLSILIIYVSFFSSCTDNSLFTDKTDSQNKRIITGFVHLSGKSDHSGIYVYLEGFDVGIQTATDGSFKIVLPGNAQTQPISGAYKLYFYMDNYSFKSADILAVDGELQYGHGDLNSDGALIKTVVLQKLLDIVVSISPNTINTNFSGPVTAFMQLSTAGMDTIDVRTVQAKPRQFSGLFLINLANPDDVRILKTSSRLVDTEVSGNEKWDMIIPWGSSDVPAGRYEVIPFIKILHPNFPTVLDGIFGVNSGNFTTDFLNIPQRRSTAIFTVLDAQ